MSAKPVLAIGPANYAGQAYEWAEAVERFLRVPAKSFAYSGKVVGGLGSGTFQFPIHKRLPHHRLTSNGLKAHQMRGVLGGVTHLAIDGFLPIYGRLDKAHIGHDMERIEAQDLNLALIAHGGDVRDPDAHMRRYSYSFFSRAPTAWVDSLRVLSEKNRSIARSLGTNVFVSTPDLLLDLPFATWLPLCIPVESWRCARPAFVGARLPTVLHLPSRRRPAIKGTAVIDSVLLRLQKEGLIRYLHPEAVSHVAMRRLVWEADIVVDQILTGSYGVAAVEGLAAGRLVVGNVGDAVRDLIPQSVPIVDATPYNFEVVMRLVTDDVKRYRALSELGPEYAATWHDGRTSAMSLATFLL